MFVKVRNIAAFSNSEFLLPLKIQQCLISFYYNRHEMRRANGVDLTAEWPDPSFHCYLYICQ